MKKRTLLLVGNPNVGKSTLFNAMTGLRQHTGNWPGKTVGTACGSMVHGDTCYTVVDLPGTYSLEGSSEDERLAAECIKSEPADCTVIVCDGSCLERSLILALQVLPLCDRAVVCVNLMDEARKRGLEIRGDRLSEALGVPVVLTAAGRSDGIGALLEAVEASIQGPPLLEKELSGDVIELAEKIARGVTRRIAADGEPFRRRVDRLLVSRRFGVPFLFLILLGILWLTVWGANYPGQLLERLFSEGYGWLRLGTGMLPWWLTGFLLDGVYMTCSRVISVMLPPMAIFFPLFTVLEDVGYLPRMAFLLDPGMARCGGCGRQALTLCMGLGCNAVGVTGCRIIASPRERLCAILTNAFVPCNGRFPTLILLGSLFFPHVGAALVVAACVALGVVGAMVVSGLLSRTVLRSAESTFVMELPPFRRPRLGRILLRSWTDKILLVSKRALLVAAPAGGILWICANTPLLGWLAGFLEPVGLFMGMNGVILLAFLFSLPANELLIPVILMALTQAGSLAAVTTSDILRETICWQQALCTMVFTLFHWPCATTLMTIYRETGSKKKTAAACLLPTAVGCLVCILLNLIL